MVTKKADPKATEKQASDTTKFSFNPSDWPIGSTVRYTAERVSDHKGMTGTIVGYRPTSGLWVKFPHGKGSISVKSAALVTKGKAVTATPSKTRQPAVKTDKPAKSSKTAKPKDTPAEQTT
jgi:hypothetical protein